MAAMQRSLERALVEEVEGNGLDTITSNMRVRLACANAKRDPPGAQATDDGCADIARCAGYENHPASILKITGITQIFPTL